MTATHSTFAGVNTPSFQGLQLLCRIPYVPTDKCGETAPLFAASEETLYPPLRQWAKSTKTHSTDQNHLCESRYNRHVYCAGKIGSAGETAVVWRFMGLHGDESGLRFLHADDSARLTNFPFPSEPTEIVGGTDRLTVRIKMERNRIRLHRLVANYEADWHTQAEREDLLRATKKARRSPYGLPPRKIVKGEDGSVPLNIVPTLKTGNLPKPSEDLLSEWNTALYEATKDEKTPLNEEIDFYQQPISEHGGVQRSNDGRERSLDDEKVSERQFDDMNYEGMRETGSWQSTDQVEPVPEPHREKWLAPRRLHFNPLGKRWNEVTADDIADVSEHPDFAQTTREYDIEFSNLRVNEAAEQLGLKPNTLSKRISREELNSMFHDVDFSQTMGHYFCIVTLNGADHLKILGKADAALSEVLVKFLDEWRKSETNAIKQVRKTAKKSGADQQAREKEERDAVEGVRDAYQVVIGLFAPDKDGLGCTYFSFYGHQELIEAALSEWAA